jgi:hypothetical protein
MEEDIIRIEEIKKEYSTMDGLKEYVKAIENILNRLEQDERVIEEAIEFIKDNCIEEIADMKGHYREIASIGDLEELLNILKRN